MGQSAGRKRGEHGGSKGDTQGLLHENSPFSGANVRKISLVLSFVSMKGKIGSNSKWEPRSIFALV
jgi:hypothetical protein